MRYLLAAYILLLIGCFTKELQASSSYVIVTSTEIKVGFNDTDWLRVHLTSSNGFKYVLDTRIDDTTYFKTGKRLPFLSPR